MAESKPIDPKVFHSVIDYNREDGLLVWSVSTGKARKGNEVGGTLNSNGYKRFMFKQRDYLYHRVVWAIHYNKTPPSIIDHINGDKLDNRIENLRDGTKCTNQRNQTRAHKRNKTSKYLGVSNLKGRWRAKIYTNGKYIFLGYFATEEDARDAYLDAKEIHHKIKKAQ